MYMYTIVYLCIGPNNSTLHDFKLQLIFGICIDFYDYFQYMD